MSDIWIVTADTDYEGFTNLKAFTDEAQADAFAAECNAYNATMPCAPGVVEDSPENDEEWDKYTADMKAWEATHPAGEWYTGQHYTYSMQKCALESRPTPEQSRETREEWFSGVNVWGSTSAGWIDFIDRYEYAPDEFIAWLRAAMDRSATGREG